jgi:hypothetical protein
MFYIRLRERHENLRGEPLAFSLDKLEGFFVIKSKPYLSKNKEVKQHG